MRRLVLMIGIGTLFGCGAAAPSSYSSTQSTQALEANNGRELNGRELNGRELNGRGLNGRGLNGRGLNGRGLNGRGLNGRGLNGRGLNGRGLNGRGLNGRGLNGRGLNDALLANTLSRVAFAPAVLAGGTAVSDASLDGTALVAHSGGRTYSAADFAGAYFTGKLGDGTSVLLRIDSVTPAASATDLDLYQVSWFNPGRHGGWSAICTDDQGQPTAASAVANYWDYSQGTATGGSKIYDSHAFTFACEEGAIYKCMDWGYRPWESVGGQSMDAYHQACTRMTRADYCGDGNSNTIDGSWINLYDNLGIQVDTDTWEFEAQWSANGATCLAPTGVDHHTSRLSCYDRLASSNCTADSPGALISSETPNGKRSPALPGEGDDGQGHGNGNGNGGGNGHGHGNH